MKLVEKIASSSGSPFYTFEFFPPKTEQGFENLAQRIGRLAYLRPLAATITWGAGGSTKDRSLELATVAQSDYGLDAVLHLTCTNMEKGMVDDVLRTAKERGIQNILALRGDPPRGQEYWMPTDPRFVHSIDLVSYIRGSLEFSSFFCIGVAAYPDGHPDHELDEEEELMHLKRTVDAGADFVITQLFYDVENYLRWLQKLRSRGISIPVVPGIMPLQTYESFLRLTKLCGTRVTPALNAELDSIKRDDQLVKEFGVRLATDMVRKLTTSGQVSGVHFCTLNLEKSVSRVLENLGWVSGNESPSVKNKLIVEASDSADQGPPPDSDLLVSPSTAAFSVTRSQSSNTYSSNSSRELGRGELNSASSWDEFPNGRFGDFKSPAFGMQDQWGGSNATGMHAASQWGTPVTKEDLTNLFFSYLQSKAQTTPFSPEPLSPESRMILSQLQELTKRGWWTVGSQPAIDAAPSEDPIVGWGPKGGYVFQKAFVEFFAEHADVEAIEAAIATRGNGWIEYFAASAKGDCKTNVVEGGRNAVTWGVFPGQEIAQSTIIEQDSFLSWKEDAFATWNEWASSFAPDSPSRRLLDAVKDEMWLVNIVHHDYKNPSNLWDFICRT